MSLKEYYLIAFNYYDQSQANKMNILSGSYFVDSLRIEMQKILINKYLRKFGLTNMPVNLRQYCRLEITTFRKSFFSSKLIQKIEMFKGEHFDPNLAVGMDDFNLTSHAEHLVGELIATSQNELDSVEDYIDNATIILENDYIFIRYQYANQTEKHSVALQIIEKV